MVDDDVEVAALHGLFVDRHPAFTVVATAHSGPAAFTLVAEHRPDLVLLDFNLPGTHGLDVLRDIRALGDHQPEVIAVTAARDVESVRQARSGGIHHYLVKPFTASALQARLDHVARDRLALVGARRDELAQREIDALLHSPAHKRLALPKGCSAETLETVELALAGASNSTAGELAMQLGISRVSTRRYLEFLAAAGLAVKTLDYGTTGRPSTRYSARV